MKLEIYNGDFVGTVEWKSPGHVECDMNDAGQQQWFERYFETEDAYLSGPVECAEMEAERRDASKPAFERAAYQLAAYAYEVTRRGAGSAGPRDEDRARRHAHYEGRAT